MRAQKIPVIRATVSEVNESGEEIYNYAEDGYILGKISYVSGTDAYGIGRNESENVVKIYCEKIYNLTRKDRLLIDGLEWLVSAVPEKWINDRGYRSAYVITATMVEG